MINPSADILIKVLNKLGHLVFTEGDYNLNLIGVRKDYVARDIFDDTIILLFKEGGLWKVLPALATTDPGFKYLEAPMNPQGTAIIAEGQYRGVWKRGMHKGKVPALVQVGSFLVHRDNNMDRILDKTPKVIAGPGSGLNMHPAKEKGTSTIVGGWSAGCQVFANWFDHDRMLTYYDLSVPRYGEKITYTLIKEADFKLV